MATLVPCASAELHKSAVASAVATILTMFSSV
jgi:hypothetical protein